MFHPGLSGRTFQTRGQPVKKTNWPHLANLQDASSHLETFFLFFHFLF
jgi:hypothetical protein